MASPRCKKWPNLTNTFWLGWKHRFIFWVDLISPPNSLGEMIDIVCLSFSTYVDTFWRQKPNWNFFPTETIGKHCDSFFLARFWMSPRHWKGNGNHWNSMRMLTMMGWKVCKKQDGVTPHPAPATTRIFGSLKVCDERHFWPQISEKCMTAGELCFF